MRFDARIAWARGGGLVRLLRPAQWLKNAFVLAPLLFTGAFLNQGALRGALSATLLFCLAASAVYIVNDIHDLESDRRHPVKSKRRPLASGAVSVREASALLTALLIALAIGGFFAPGAMTAIAAYLVLNLAYTFALKNMPVIDLFSIAAGFVLRVAAGAKALEVPVSSWMFITSLCLALYLAAVKRRQELVHNGPDGRKVLRRYSVRLVERYAEMSATGALVFYSLFVMSSRPELAVTIPLVLFGLFRYWYIVETENGGESPTDALLADKPLCLAILLWIAACARALWPS